MKKSGLLFVGLIGVAVMLGFNNVSASCDEDFYGTLRHNKQYTFGDDFHANSSDKWIQKASGVFSEQYDYNRGSNPSFGWTDAIKTAKGKVSKNTTMSVLVANAKYPILDVPASRSYDNLLVTYTITYSTDSEGKNKYVHTECKHYEISRCGDGVLDSAYETCDPNDSTHAGWGDNGCDASCKPIAAKDPVCSSTYKGTKYTTSSDHWLKSTDNLCDEGEVVDFSYTPATGGPRSYEWNCKSGSKKTNPKCSAKQQWCGDGEKNGSETCDPNDSTHAGWGDNGCDASCKPIAAKDPVCSSTYKGTKYTTSSDHWLKSTDNLCDEGKVVDFSYTPATGGPRTYTWNCESGSKKTDPKCSAKQQWCGDGEKNGSETCDPNDSSHTGWGKDGCDNSCNPINNSEGGTLDTEKTLISESKYVTKVGQEMVWQIKVTAKGGDVNNVTIKDYLPEVLTYVSYEETLPSGVTMKAGQPTSGTDSTGDYLQWETSGTLKEGKSIVLVVTTEVNKMPKLSDNYENVACAKAEGVTEDCDKKPVEKGYLEPEKTLIGEKKEITKVGQDVEWNLKVTAKGGDVENPIITDILPPVLGYSGYEVTRNPGLAVYVPVTGTTITGGVEVETVEWKAIGTLKENEYIQIKLITYAKVMPDRDYKNVLCVHPKNQPDDEKCADVPVPAPKLWIKKSFTDGSKKKTVKINDEIAYKISFGNSGDASATITSIKDFLPKNVEYVTGSITINGSTHSNQNGGSEVINTNTSVDGVYVDIYGGITLNPGDSGYIILTGKVLNEHLDTTKQNWACIYLNDKKPDDDIIDGDWCDWAEHEIDNGLCEKLDIPSGNIGKSGGSKTVSCTASEQVDSIEIDCGNGTIFTGSNISSLDSKTCSYPAGAKTYSLKCTVKKDGKDYTSDSCKGTVTVEGGGGGGDDPYCKAPVQNGDIFTCESTDKVYAIGIDCSHETGKESVDKKVESDNGREILSVSASCSKSGKVQCYVKKNSNSNWETKASGCGWEPSGGGGGGGGGGGTTPDPEIYDSVNCFNVNAGNISIQQGEILPFYWNIEKLTSVVEKGGYVAYDGNKYPYGNESNYNNIIKNGTCTSDDDGNIALNSMICSFEIRDGAGNTVKTGRYPCLDEPGEISEPLLRAWKNWSIGKYTVGSNGVPKQRELETFADTKKYRFRSNIDYISNFGANVDTFGEYKIALTKVEFAQCQDKKWVAGKISPIECQSNFVLTNPYTVQKTPSGNLKASTAILSKYKYMDGKAVMSELLNAITVSEYEPNNAVSEAMKAFKDKYQKLAVSIGDGMKKVPGKNIYFIEGNKTIKNGQFNKPFTFIQTKSDSTITIEGSITNLNMMILTEGKIRFKGIDTCNKRQEVKGIFYAGQGLSRDTVQKNTSISNNQWCTEGGLTVKGVLIGKGLQGMMDNSRSNLNGWFETTDKKGTVMNGASVLIEYSPSVFTKSTMPPGAEDFTTALSIYKN